MSFWTPLKMLGSSSRRTAGLRHLWQEYDKLWNPRSPQTGNGQALPPSILAKAIFSPRFRGMFSSSRMRALGQGKRFYLQNGQMFESSTDDRSNLPGPVAMKDGEKDKADRPSEKRTSEAPDATRTKPSE